MNLFRSEAHAKQWAGYREEASAGLLPLSDIMAIFSAALFRERLSTTYISHLRGHAMDLAETAKRVTRDSPFWRRQVT